MMCNNEVPKILDDNKNTYLITISKNLVRDSQIIDTSDEKFIKDFSDKKIKYEEVSNIVWEEFSNTKWTDIEADLVGGQYDAYTEEEAIIVASKNLEIPREFLKAYELKNR